MNRPVPAIVAAFRRAREKAGLTQRTMAERLNTCPTAVRHFEGGRWANGITKVDRWFRSLDLEIVAVSTDPLVRAQEAAEWLRAQGWTVEAPVTGESE